MPMSSGIATHQDSKAITHRLVAKSGMASVIQSTTAQVNEDVRGLEAHVRTMEVLVAEVRGGDALLSATRVLKHEALLDMKVNNLTLRNVLNSNVSVKRSSYKWYIFSDEVLVCSQARDGLFHMKALLSLHDDDGSGALIVTPKEGKDVKPEVFFVNDGGLEYKCWARSVDEKDALLKLLSGLRAALAPART